MPRRKREAQGKPEQKVEKLGTQFLYRQNPGQYNGVGSALLHYNLASQNMKSWKTRHMSQVV